jgi:hypothetical protein
MPVIDSARWQLSDLRAREVFALFAALQTVHDEDDEHFPRVNEARVKVRLLCAELRTAGLERDVARRNVSGSPGPHRSPVSRMRRRRSGRASRSCVLLVLHRCERSHAR